VVVDAVAQDSVLTQKIAHLADRAAHGNELGGEPHLGLGLTTLDALDTVDQIGAELVEALVGLARFLADALQDLDGQVGRLHVCLRNYAPDEEQATLP
jgi:hypothetical protein